MSEAHIFYPIYKMDSRVLCVVFLVAILVILVRIILLTLPNKEGFITKGYPKRKGRSYGGWYDVVSYHPYPTPVTDNICESICNSDPTCKTFRYDYNTNGNNCWLK
jgi:hypothetical protein